MDLNTTLSAQVALEMSLGLLEWRRLQWRLRIQKEVRLRDLACRSVDCDHWEAHLKNPAVHDIFDT